jgi:hypothetical protein
MLAKEFSPRDEIQVLYDRDVINKVLSAQKYAEHIERCEKEQNTIDDVFWHKDVGGIWYGTTKGRPWSEGSEDPAEDQRGAARVWSLHFPGSQEVSDRRGIRKKPSS